MIIVGEKLNGSIPSVARAIADRDEEKLRALAVKQDEAGADYLDVCASAPAVSEVGVERDINLSALALCGEVNE